MKKQKKTKHTESKKKAFERKWSNLLKNNKFIIILFLLSTSFFVYQHAINTSWDFSAYVLNSKYWFDESSYFEPLRPPLMPLILGILSFAGWKAAEFIFIILASILFAYSSTRLAKSIKFNPAGFYFLSLNFYLLSYGLINGTELLALIFLELFISFLIENKYISGLFLGLSVLSRYSGLVLFPLIFLHLKFRQILKSFLIFAGVISLWFVYNFYKFGNFFTSIADQYANNVFYRDYIVQNIKLNHFITVQNILLPFFVLGLIIVLIKLFKKIKSSKNFRFDSILKLIESLKIEIIMIFLLVFSVLSYSSIPVKNPRYLFNLILPTVYFAYIGAAYCIKKFRIEKKILILIASVILIIFLVASVQLILKEHASGAQYESAVNKTQELGIFNCSIESNAWVYLNYYGLPSSPSPRFEMVNSRVEHKQILILFKHEGEPEYAANDSFIKSLPVLYTAEDYSIIGHDECAPPVVPFDESYMQQLEKIIIYTRGHHINTNPCFLLFMNRTFAEKTCNFVNFNGFRQDENRFYE